MKLYGKVKIFGKNLTWGLDTRASDIMLSATW